MPLRHGSLAIEVKEANVCERGEGRGHCYVVPSGLFPRGASGVCLVTLCLKRATVIKRNISIVAAKLKRNKRQQGVARRKQEVP